MAKSTTKSPLVGRHAVVTIGRTIQEIQDHVLRRSAAVEPTMLDAVWRNAAKNCVIQDVFQVEKKHQVPGPCRGRGIVGNPRHAFDHHGMKDFSVYHLTTLRNGVIV